MPLVINSLRTDIQTYMHWSAASCTWFKKENKNITELVHKGFKTLAMQKTTVAAHYSNNENCNFLAYDL